MPVHGVFRAAVQGVRDRGDGGFVYVRGDECGYMFPRELRGQDDARRGLDELLEAPAASRVFYVVEERDGHLHVLAYPRERVLRELVEDAQQQMRGAATEEPARVEEVTAAPAAEANEPTTAPTAEDAAATNVATRDDTAATNVATAL